MKNINKKELFNIFESSNSISEVLKKLNVSDNSSNWKKIKLLAIEIGFDVEIYKKRKKKFCLNCGKELKKGQVKFCSKSCSATFNNKGRIVSNETKEKIREKLIKPKITKIKIKKEKVYIKHYCENCGIEIKNYKFCSLKCSGQYKHKKSYEYFINNPTKFNVGNYSPINFKNFIMKEQENKCAICGCEPIWNGKEIHFVIDHIDGDASNNRRENIRMICPNCDSQTDTFKSRNKNSTRRNYWKDKIIRDIKKDM